MNINDQSYLAFVIEEAIRNKISINLHNKKFVYADEVPVRGFFCDEENKLSCGFGYPHKSWFPIFVHESCHMDQFLHSREFWDSSVVFRGKDLYGVFFDWLHGEIELSKEMIKRSSLACINLELDCEKRAVGKIKEWELSLDIEDYIKRANCYVLFYNFARKHRIWYPLNKSSDSFSEILEQVSSRFNYNYNQLPRFYEQLIIEHCFDNDLEEAKNKFKLNR